MRGWMKSLRKHRESAMCGSMTRLGPQLGASAVILGSAWQLPGNQFHPITGITDFESFPHSMCTTPAPLKGGWGRGTILRLKRRANGRSGVSPRGGYTPSGGTLLRQLPPAKAATKLQRMRVPPRRAILGSVSCVCCRGGPR